MYLAFDPGATTGVAEFTDDGELLVYYQHKFDELCAYLEGYDEPVKVVICEDFRIRSAKAKSFIGSRMETVQAIGAIKSFALRKKAEYVLQDAGIKGIAERWTGIKPPSNHSQSHWIDALNHGAYYLVKNGIRKTILEEQNKNAL